MLELLEDRIAPAGIVPLSQGANVLSAGQQAGTSFDSAPLIKVLAGKAMVFWDPDAGVITGISVSDKANLEIYTDVRGDIVTNLIASGNWAFLTDSDNDDSNGRDGGVLLDSSIAGIRVLGGAGLAGDPVAGNVGRIVAGGSISNVFVSGSLGGVFAGDGIFDAIATSTSAVLANGTPSTTFEYRIGFDFDGDAPINATSMFLTQADAKFAPRASITNVSFTTGENVQFFAGDGRNGATGTAAIGGSISKISVVAAAIDPLVNTGFFAGKSLTISAGDGGNGSLAGGAGGGVSSITDRASSGHVGIYSGQGGDGVNLGGTGGLISLLDLRGNPTEYRVQAGDGGDGRIGAAGGGITQSNIASTSSSQFITLAGNFHSSFEKPLGGPDVTDSDLSRGFFVIDRSSGEMALINGQTLTTIGGAIAPLASSPVDAIVADVNADNFLDVVVAYADGSFGVLVNDQADGFRYSVGSLGGLIPQKVLVGDFMGNGTPSDLVFIGSTSTTTTIRTFEATNAAAFDGLNPAAAYTSDTTRLGIFTLNRGNLADAVGGSFPLSTLGSLRLNADAKDDIVLAFRDGFVQGVFATGSGTTNDPLTFNTGTTSSPAPKFTVKNGVKDLDFNYAKAAGQQRISIVDGAGKAVWIAAVNPGAGSGSLALLPPPLPLPAKNLPTFLEARWTTSILDAEGSATTLAVLGTNGTTSTILTYNGRFEFKARLDENGLVNTMANNFFFTSIPPLNNGNTKISGEADSWFFSGGDPTLGQVFQGKLPEKNLTFGKVNLPFDAKSVVIVSGSGGDGSASHGGTGGNIASLNVNSGTVSIETGRGGSSVAGTGGKGGSLDNARPFTTPDRQTISPTLSAKTTFLLDLGDGGSATGTTTAARGGAGGDILNTIFADYGTLTASAGDGGSSTGGAAGAGGALRNITIYNGADATLAAGAGGSGLIGLRAAGGAGGSLTGLRLGDPDPANEKIVSGNLLIFAGAGGASALAAPGAGGSISSVVAGGFNKALGAFSATAGAGGSTNATTAIAGGAGGSVFNISLNKVRSNISLQAGDGGWSDFGNGGAGGAVRAVTSMDGGLLSASAGLGGSSLGNGSKGRGGAGGSIVSVNAEMNGNGFPLFSAGNGGLASGGAGGIGGSISGVTIKANPTENPLQDSTLGFFLRAGTGGEGTSGGNGGSISGFRFSAVYDEQSGNQGIVNSIALLLTAGRGGLGTTTTGGTGGSVTLSSPLAGISQIGSLSQNSTFTPGDEGLRIFAGDGGDGRTAGGAGGNISGVRTVNTPNTGGAQFPAVLLGGAYLQAGDGGDTDLGNAGKGGSVTATNISVQGKTSSTGNLRMEAGDGGTSLAGAGGIGGSISSGTLVVVRGNDAAGYGLLARAGQGGDGTLRGGAGGSVINLSTTLPQVGVGGSFTSFSGVILAGDGGDGTGATLSKGGAGGGISGIRQAQNVGTSINILLAGSGGDSSSDVAGGKGGDVRNVSTGSSIGAQTAKTSVNASPVRQGIFNTIATSALIESYFATPDVPQGIFSGLGGQGLVRGANGAVVGIVADSIAAIAAANSAGTFEAASGVSSVRSFLVAYDLSENDTTYQTGDGFVLVANGKISGLVSFDNKIKPTASVVTRTANYINPVL